MLGKVRIKLAKASNTMSEIMKYNAYIYIHIHTYRQYNISSEVQNSTGTQNLLSITLLTLHISVLLSSY